MAASTQHHMCVREILQKTVNSIEVRKIYKHEIKAKINR